MGGLPMRSFRFKHFAVVVAFVASGAPVAAVAQTRPYEGIGRTPTQEEIRAWDVTTGPAGKELPPGRGTAKEGAAIYAVKCAMCHGVNLQGADAPAGSGFFLGGWRLAATSTPVWDSNPFPGAAKYYAFPTTLWNVGRRSMPLM